MGANREMKKSHIQSHFELILRSFKRLKHNYVYSFILKLRPQSIDAGSTNISRIVKTTSSFVSEK